MKWYHHIILLELLLIGVLVFIILNKKEPPVIISDPIVDTIYEPMIVYERYDSIIFRDSLISSGVYTEITGRTDTFYLTKTDTVKIVEDWGTLRKYETPLFDIVNFGKCDVSMELEFNRVNHISYELIQYKQKPKLEFYTGITIFNRLSALSAGVSYNHFTGLLHVGYDDHFTLGTTLLYKF